MKKLALFACALLAAGAVRAQSAPAAAPPIVVSGMLADETAKGALLARLRQVFGPERVVDQLSVGPVSAPPNWNDYLGKLVGPNLKLVSHGQLKVDGSAVSLRGDVASEAQRQQIAADLAASLHPSYTVNNGLRVAASEQSLLDAALANRIIEFESGKATLTESGRAILDQMSVALLKLKDKKVEVIGRFTQQLPCNWKLYMENVRDTYHASLLHTFFTTFRITRLSQGGGVMVGENGVAHASTTLAPPPGPDDTYAGMRADNQGFQLKDPSFLRSVQEFGDDMAPGEAVPLALAKTCTPRAQ